MGFNGILLEALVDPRSATVATTIQCTHISCAVTSPTLLSNPYPQQDILRLAGIQCQHLLRPQPEVQTWLHHQGKMALFNWKTHNSLETPASCKNLRRIQVDEGLCHTKERHRGVARHVVGCGVSQDRECYKNSYEPSLLSVGHLRMGFIFNFQIKIRKKPVMLT